MRPDAPSGGPAAARPGTSRARASAASGGRTCRFFIVTGAPLAATLPEGQAAFQRPGTPAVRLGHRVAHNHELTREVAKRQAALAAAGALVPDYADGLAAEEREAGALRADVETVRPLRPRGPARSRLCRPPVFVLSKLSYATVESPLHPGPAEVAHRHPAG